MSLYAAERELREQYLLLAGVDEAGRGALAGPVVVAAVILDAARPIAGLNDSKKLTARRREALYDAIVEQAVGYKVIEMSAAEVDRLNVLQASLLGMRLALEGLTPAASYALVDGNHLPVGLPCPASAEVKGDGHFACIAAASIVAKVWRDRLMCALHQQYPAYGFDRHKGYGAAAHMRAIRQHGICPQHRKTYAPCSQMTLDM